jgi:hypothetical protein
LTEKDVEQSIKESYKHDLIDVQTEKEKEIA